MATAFRATPNLLDIVPEDERPIYIGLANTTLGVVTFLPVLGGWLVANIGYSGAFGIGVTFALLGLGASLRLTETRLAVATAQRVTSDA
jgi:MFS family permease